MGDRTRNRVSQLCVFSRENEWLPCPEVIYIVSCTSTLIRKSKVESLVSIDLSGFLVRLVLNLLLRCHLIPLCLLLLVQADEVLALHEEDDYRERQD